MLWYITITVKHNKINQYFLSFLQFFCFLVFWGSCKESRSGIEVHICNANSLQAEAGKW